jgi:hypothetical protein
VLRGLKELAEVRRSWLKKLPREVIFWMIYFPVKSRLAGSSLKIRDRRLVNGRGIPQEHMEILAVP